MYYEVYKGGLEFLFSTELEGFKLYALKDYPFAVRTNHPNDFIQVEVFKITKPEVEVSIHELELHVGYYYDEIQVNSITAGIYLFHQPENYPEVKGGDWVKSLGAH